MTKTHATPGSPFSTRHALIVAGLLIGGSLILVLLTPNVVSRDLAVASLGSTVLVVVARAFHGRTRGQRA